MYASELVTVALVAVLQSLDALPERLADDVVVVRGVNASVGVLSAVGTCRHGRENPRGNPIDELEQGMVVAVAEQWQLSHVAVCRAVCAEVPREEAVRHGDVLHLVAAVEDNHSFFALAHDFRFRV